MGTGVIKMLVSRPLYLAAARVEAGIVLTVDLLEAAELLDSGRAELVDSDDRDLVNANRKVELAKTLARLPQLRLVGADDGPWIKRFG